LKPYYYLMTTQSNFFLQNLPNSYCYEPTTKDELLLPRETKIVGGVELTQHHNDNICHLGEEEKASRILIGIAQQECTPFTPQAKFFSLQERHAMINFAVESMLKYNAVIKNLNMGDSGRVDVNASELIDEEIPSPHAKKRKHNHKITIDRPVVNEGVSALEPIETFVLHRDGDEKQINGFHCVLRRDVLEGFFYKYNKIGFRCRYCKNESNKEKQAVILPESIEGIYRAVGRFKKEHFFQCSCIPRGVVRKANSEKSRGGKLEWEISAKKKGLRNIPGGKGITLCPDILAKISKNTI